MQYVDINSNLNQDNVSGETAIKNSVINILSTHIGSVPGHPEFGSNISKYLFQPLDPLTTEMIKAEVRYAIERWEIRVGIKDIIVKEDIDYNRLDIEIKYYLKNDRTTENSLIYSFSR